MCQRYEHSSEFVVRSPARNEAGANETKTNTNVLQKVFVVVYIVKWSLTASADLSFVGLVNRIWFSYSSARSSSKANRKQCTAYRVVYQHPMQNASLFVIATFQRNRLLACFCGNFFFAFYEPHPWFRNFVSKTSICSPCPESWLCNRPSVKERRRVWISKFFLALPFLWSAIVQLWDAIRKPPGHVLSSFPFIMLCGKKIDTKAFGYLKVDRKSQRSLSCIML